MTSKEIKSAIEYWKKTAERDHETMLGLFKIKRYPESLFFGHIILEKVLKGLYVKQTKNQVPYTHDLAFLNKDLENDLSVKQNKFLDEVNNFNIRARYPDTKLKFYKECTKEYSEKKLEAIEIIYKKLWKKLEQ